MQANSQTDTPRLPTGALIIGAIGALALAAGILTLIGVGESLLPMLSGRPFGFALVTVGIALCVIEARALIRYSVSRQRLQQTDDQQRS